MSEISGEDNKESSSGPAILVPKKIGNGEGNKCPGLECKKGLRR